MARRKRRKKDDSIVLLGLLALVGLIAATARKRSKSTTKEVADQAVEIVVDKLSPIAPGETKRASGKSTPISDDDAAPASSPDDDYGQGIRPGYPKTVKPPGE